MANKMGKDAYRAEGSRDGDYFEDVNVPLMVTLGIVAVVVVYLSITFMTAWFYKYQQAEIERKVISQKFESLAKLEREQTEKLSSYRWVDKEKGIVAIPIDRAMELIVAEYSGGRDDKEGAKADKELPTKADSQGKVEKW